MNKKILFLLFCFTFELLPMDYVSGVFSATISFAKKFIASETVKTVVVASASAIVATKYFSKVSSWFTQNRQEQKGNGKGEPTSLQPGACDTPKQNGSAKNGFVTHDQLQQFADTFKSSYSNAPTKEDLQQYALRDHMTKELNGIRSDILKLQEELGDRVLQKVLKALQNRMQTAEAQQHERIIIPLQKKVDGILDILKKEIEDRSGLNSIVDQLNTTLHQLMEDFQEKCKGRRFDRLKIQSGSFPNEEYDSPRTDQRISLDLFQGTDCPDSPGADGSRPYR